ncbi:MAG: HAMP domain-containing protein [Firmicutes bacterium]|nr:HAMP domain-containing protein [Bacillota bacterium]
MKIGVGARIAGGYAVLVLALAAVGLYGTNGIRQVDSTYRDQILDHHVEAITVIHELDAQVAKRIVAVTNYAETREETYLSEAQEHENNTAALLARAEQIAQSEQDRQLLANARAQIDEYNAVAADIVTHTKASDTVALNRDLYMSAELEKRLSDVLNSWVTLAKGQANVARVEAKRTADSVQTVTLIITVVAAVFAVGTGMLMARSIVRPLGALTAAATSMAGGDLTVDVPVVKSKDEIGQLTAAFKGMLDSLREIVRKTSKSAEQVAASSEQLSATSEEASNAIQQVSASIQQVAKETNAQADGARETGKVLSQLSSAIDQVAQGAQSQSKSLSDATRSVDGMVKAVERIGSASEQVAVAAETARECAQTGRQAIEKTVAGMETISKTSDDIRSNINGLAEHSQRIVEIVQVISDIADQTNLLALNAAIEAARAGEHGRGFAVVADEVRRLAERSSKSTKEIAGLISDIRKSTDASVRSVGVGAEAVQEGFKLASEAREILGKIVSAVENAGVEFERIRESLGEVQDAGKAAMAAVDSSASVVEEATAATEEMSASSSQVLSSADAISKGAEKNAAAVEEVSASAEEVNASIEEMANSAQSLASMAQGLKEIVAAFEL